MNDPNYKEQLYDDIIYNLTQLKERECQDTRETDLRLYKLEQKVLDMAFLFEDLAKKLRS